jgi:phage portal protein BeeE
VGILERIASARGEQRYSADTYMSEYVMPFQYGGHTYGVPGANGLVQTLAGNRASEIVRTLPGYAAALRQCPPAFAAQNVRATVLSQARFTFRNRSTKRVFSNTKLAPLEAPWANAGTGELIARMEWSAGLAGNAYVLRQAKRLRVLRPDWVAVVYGSQQEPEDAAQALDGELLGYVYQNGGLWSDRHNPTPLLPEDVAHWSPIPDPEHAGVGQSWITPAVRDMQQDRMAGEHTIRFFENGATPNLVVKGIPAATVEQFNDLVAMMEETHSGVANAYKTLYLTAGADATIVGANLADLDLKSVHGSAETRIASLSRVHPVILGIAEGLAGSSLNAGNFGMARRIWADTWIYPTLQDLASSLASIIDVPRDAELWFDTRDIPLLREDGKDAADIASTQAQTIRTLLDAGYTPESVQAAVQAQDWSILKHTGLFSVQLQPPGGNKQDTTIHDTNQKVEALGTLFRAGYDAAASLEMLGLPPLKHTGLLPVTLAKKEALPEQPTEKQPKPAS